VAWYGPIVMNTQQQLRQAVNELNDGTFYQAPLTRTKQSVPGPSDESFLETKSRMLVLGLLRDDVHIDRGRFAEEAVHG